MSPPLPARLKLRLFALVARHPALSRLLFNRLFRKGHTPHKPNQFVQQAISGLTPGTALDITMGDGRNAVFLAAQRWQVTGFDISEQALAKARQSAEQAGVTLTAIHSTAGAFDYGDDRWDLIVLCYAWAAITDATFLARLKTSLRKHGRIVYTHFLRQPAAPIPKAVGVVDPGELPRLFHDFEMLHYEETSALPDWQPPGTERKPLPLVRMIARKPL